MEPGGGLLVSNTHVHPYIHQHTDMSDNQCVSVITFSYNKPSNKHSGLVIYRLTENTIVSVNTLLLLAKSYTLCQVKAVYF